MVAWAREFRGLTIEEAADKLAVPIDELQAIELGEKQINLTFFRKLSDRFRIPRATLLRQTRPTVPPMPMDFRTFEGRPPHIGFETRLAISYAYTIEQNVLELVEADAAPATPVLPQLRMADNAEEAGEAERRRIGPSHAAQLGWRFADGFGNWRAIVEGIGPYVLMKKFEVGDCRGFTIFRDANAPLIVINKNERHDPARTFTLFHEYGHLLLRQPGISDLNDQNPVEAFCNRFAGAFLMPRALIRDLLPRWPDRPVDWPIDDIRLWARRLKVSQQALALRLEALGVAPVGFFRGIVARQREVAPPAPDDGGNYVNTQVFELGGRYTAAVLSAQQRHVIGNGEASEMLDLAPRHFEKIRARFERRAPDPANLGQ